MSGKYDDFDWDELPKEIQEAARVLGFTKALWDNDEEPEECDEYWRDLTPEQQAAAKKLGYDEKMWDGS
jgi:hypothetical protein